MYSKPQHNLVLDSTPLRGNLKLQKQFLRELVPFFPKAERTAIKAQIGHGEALDVNTALLPDFPRQMLKKYVVFRGPNCFHAALAFQSTILPSSSFINVKEEPGYHRAMINYDELWRAIKRDFYEIDPRRQPIKYGDMLVSSTFRSANRISLTLMSTFAGSVTRQRTYSAATLSQKDRSHQIHPTP
jgi:hypothetical protein